MDGGSMAQSSFLPTEYYAPACDHYDPEDSKGVVSCDECGDKDIEACYALPGTDHDTCLPCAREATDRSRDGDLPQPGALTDTWHVKLSSDGKSTVFYKPGETATEITVPGPGPSWTIGDLRRQLAAVVHVQPEQIKLRRFSLIFPERSASLEEDTALCRPTLVRQVHKRLKLPPPPRPRRPAYGGMTARMLVRSNGRCGFGPLCPTPDPRIFSNLPTPQVAALMRQRALDLAPTSSQAGEVHAQIQREFGYEDLEWHDCV